MEYSELKITLELVAILLTVVATFFALSKSIALSISYLIDKYVAWRRKRMIIGLIIEPTLEELAKYGAPLRSQNEIQTLRKPRRVITQGIENEDDRLRAEGRLLILGSAMFVAFLSIAIRYTMLAS